VQKSEKIPVLATVLFLVTAIVAFVLAAVHSITAPIIEKRAEEELMLARKAVLQEAESFSVYEGEASFSEEVAAVYIGETDGKQLGYCVNVKPIGYGGEIEMLVGITKAGKVCGVQILSMSETAGLGSKAQDASFLQQYIGKMIGQTLSVIKNGKPGEDEIAAVSGATVTSKAVTKGIQAALDTAVLLEGEWAK